MSVGQSVSTNPKACRQSPKSANPKVEKNWRKATVLVKKNKTSMILENQTFYMAVWDWT